MKTFVEQLREHKASYIAFAVTLRKKGLIIEQFEGVRTTNTLLRSCIEDWLNILGFTFNIEFKPWEARVYYSVYYNGEFFDMGVDDELKSLEGLLNVYMACIKHFDEVHS